MGLFFGQSAGPEAVYEDAGSVLFCWSFVDSLDPGCHVGLDAVDSDAVRSGQG